MIAEAGSAAPQDTPQHQLDEAVAATLDPQRLPPELQPELKTRELIEMVAERSGVKKKTAKPVVEALLAILGEQLSDGREMNIKPFGKLKVQRVKKTPNGQMVVTKIKVSEETPDTLAPAAE